MFLNKLKNNKVAENKIKLPPAPFREIMFMIFYPNGRFLSVYFTISTHKNQFICINEKESKTRQK